MAKPRASWAGLLLAITAAVVLLLPTTRVAAALPADFFGMNISPFPTEKDANLMARGHVAEVRTGFLWPVIQPFPIGYNWDGTDALVARLATRGVRVFPYLLGTPSWVSSGRFDPPIWSARGLHAWTQFVATVVSRYGSNGVFWRQNPHLPYLPIRDWQAWNEPNFPQYWGGKRASAAEYAELLSVTADTIRSADPAATVVLGGLGPALTRPTQIPYWKFLRRLYRLGAGSSFDVVADHPYAAGLDGFADELKHVGAVMRQNHDDSPLWVDEYGWSSGYFRGNRLAVGARRQATLLRRSFDWAIRHRRSLNIQRLMWFDFRDPENVDLPGCLKCWAFGIRAVDGRAKPSWRAFRSFTR